MSFPMNKEEIENQNLRNCYLAGYLQSVVKHAHFNLPLGVSAEFEMQFKDRMRKELERACAAADSFITEYRKK
jgi:hypothetical protein